MINTFHTSYNPPPVPPRAGYSKPRPPGNTPLVKFLSVMLLLLMILTFGGFFWLFQKLNLQLQDGDSLQSPDGKASRSTGGPSLNGPAAHMVLKNEHKDTSGLDNLKSPEEILLWDKEHSLLEDVQLTTKGDVLTINKPGIYFIYSQVTFSKRSKSALKQAIKTKPANKKETEELLRSFCYLNQYTTDLCTASMTGIFKLHEKQQLYVTVTNTSLVNRDACSFGLYKLW